jgi:hypothetical protein
MANPLLVTRQLADALITAAKLAPGAAASNVGALSNVLTGNLPNPGLGAAVVNAVNIGAGQVGMNQIANPSIAHWWYAGGDGNVYNRTGIANSASVINGGPTLNITPTPGGTTQFLCWADAELLHSAAGATMALYVVINGSYVWLSQTAAPAPNIYTWINAQSAINLNAGANTLQLGWDTNNTGTMQRNAWMVHLLVLGLDR